MQRPKLLIVEDDADQRDLMREVLDDYFGAGTVITVDSKSSALKQELSSFDLILSDYNLPDSSGIALIQEIRSRCSTPIIMVTGENVCQIAAEAIRQGATDYVVKIGEYLYTIPLVVEKNLTLAKIKRENESLRMELERALADVRDKNTQLETSLKRVEELAATDPLTGLYNRRHFARVIEQLFAEAQRYDKDLSAVMIDLDQYKKLNDSYGHQVGDELLMLAGRCISVNMRKMDVAARYGGDEFVLLLPHASSNDAALVAGRIREEFRLASSLLLGSEKGVTMSIGIGSIKTNRPGNADQLVCLADAALYTAKEGGRDRITTSDRAKSTAA